MAVSSDLLRSAIVQISSLSSIRMAPEALVEDVTLLAKVWADEDDFAVAVASCCRALEQVAAGKVTPDPLVGTLDGWWSHHFQLRRAQGEKAVLRVVFRPREGYVEVKGFGHRFKPADIYHRMVLGSDIRL